jgi:UDP-N-acetylglucosamine transferase subunit ALG13
MAFDRLVNTVDDWARSMGRTDVFAQVGPTTNPPRFIPWTSFLAPATFRSRLQESSVLVGHAGMGTILEGLRYAKPVVIMPRRGDLRETRNDHQVATARRFTDRPGISVAFDETQLRACLAHVDSLMGGPAIAQHATPELVVMVREFISVGKRPDRLVHG